MKFGLSITIAIVLLFGACSKDGQITTNCKSCNDMQIVVWLRHHGDTIKTGKVYIKHDATDKPSEYDKSAEILMTEEGPVATFTNQLTGKYYIYADGYDPSVGKDVSGGIPVAINNNFQHSRYLVTIPVSEAGH